MGRIPLEGYYTAQELQLTFGLLFLMNTVQNTEVKSKHKEFLIPLLIKLSTFYLVSIIGM